MHLRLMGASLSAALVVAGLAFPAAAEARAPARTKKATPRPAPRPAPKPVGAMVDPVQTVFTDTGSVRTGDHRAKHVLVEYISYTCSHCANFAQASATPIKSYINSGKVKVEYRSLIRDPFDFAAALLAHCGTAPQFIGNHDYLLAKQNEWMNNAKNATPAQQNGWMQGTYTQRLTAIANDIGLITMMQSRGITPAQARTCLASEIKQSQLLAMTEEADKLGINATPYFMLDGKKLDDVHDWTTVKATLDAAS